MNTPQKPTTSKPAGESLKSTDPEFKATSETQQIALRDVAFDLPPGASQDDIYKGIAWLLSLKDPNIPDQVAILQGYISGHYREFLYQLDDGQYLFTGPRRAVSKEQIANLETRLALAIEEAKSMTWQQIAADIKSRLHVTILTQSSFDLPSPQT